MIDAERRMRQFRLEVALFRDHDADAPRSLEEIVTGADKLRAEFEHAKALVDRYRDIANELQSLMDIEGRGEGDLLIMTNETRSIPEMIRDGDAEWSSSALLRDGVKASGDVMFAADRIAAADRIDTLEAENEILRRRIDQLEGFVKGQANIALAMMKIQ